MCHNRARTDDATGANTGTGQNRYSGADPHIIFDDNRLCLTEPLSAHGNVQLAKLMIDREDHALWSHHHIVSDDDFSGHKRVYADSRVIPQFCVHAESGTLFNIYIISAASQYQFTAQRAEPFAAEMKPGIRQGHMNTY